MVERKARERLRRRRTSDSVELARAVSAPRAAPAVSDDSVQQASQHVAPSEFQFSDVAVRPPAQPPAQRIGPDGGEVSGDVAARIRARQGRGSPLEPGVQQRMEDSFSHNFADVRVHADGETDALNRGVGASAFTLGSDIFLSSDAAGKGPAGSDELLAHELTHVVQQRSATPGGPLVVGSAHDPSERDAQAQASAVARGGAAGPAHAPTAGIGRAMIQRDDPDTPGAAEPSTFEKVMSGMSTAMNVLGAVTANPVNAATGYKGPVHVEEWHEKQSPGPTPAAGARQFGAAYIGDIYKIEAKVADPAAAAISTLHVTETVDPRPDTPTSKFQIERTYPSPGTIAWTIIPLTPGRQTLNLRVADALGMNADEYGQEIEVGADPTWFKGRCSTAESKLNTLYAAGQGWFYECFQSYMAGYNAFNGALQRQSAADALVGSLLMGALFAVGGGLVGGAIGGIMKNAEEAGKTLGKTFNQVSRGALTDAYKDLGKWVVRMPDGPLREKVLGATGAGAVQADAPQASTDPTKAGVAQGAGAVAGIDPLNWFAMIQTTMNKERADAGKILTGLHEVMDEFMITDPMQTWDWDPVETVIQAATLDGKPLDQLGPVPVSLAYERSMWEVWLTNYAWKVMKNYSTFGLQTAYAYQNVGGKLEDEIDRVARKFGETGEQWIERYGGASKAEKEAEAAKFNKNSPLGQIDEALKRIWKR